MQLDAHGRDVGQRDVLVSLNALIRHRRSPDSGRRGRWCLPHATGRGRRAPPVHADRATRMDRRDPSPDTPCQRGGASASHA